MSSDYSIREAQITDEDALVQFNWNLAKETEDKVLDRAVLQAGVHGILSEPQRGFYVVAEHAGQVVGATMVTKEWSDWRNGDFWWIQSVYVVKEHRRQGIFRRLFESVKQKSQVEQVCGFRLYVERDNHTAQQTYRELGMHETEYKMFEIIG
jgi:GNAT superfamily N-acetyltransferase